MNDKPPFEVAEHKRSFTLACPMCSHDRKKSNARSLTVHRDDDGWMRYKCHHPGCEWNSWQKRLDDFPKPQTKVDDLIPIMPVPAGEIIPNDYCGDTLYWYKDLNGNPLFANRRIQIGETKLYVPFIFTKEGFVTGKKAKWPTDFKGLFGAETLPGTKRAVIVEGEKAAIAAKNIFPKSACVTWLGGANRGYDKVDWAFYLKDICSVLLWPDNDAAGKEVMNKISGLLPCKEIVIANVDHLPPKSDLADCLTKEQINTAYKTGRKISTKITGVCSIEDIFQQIKDSSKFRTTGFDIFDAHTKLPSSGLLVIEGRTKHYKTSLAVALTSKMIETGKESKVLFYNYEMKASKVFLKYIRTFNPAATEEDYQKHDGFKTVSNWINEDKLLVIDQSKQLTIKDITLACSKSEMKDGIIVIDYIQIVPMNGTFNQKSRQVMIKDLLDELRVAAHKNNILVIVLSQLTPDYANPHNDSPREAKDIHFSADLVLRVWNRDVGESHPTYNSLQKNCVVHTYLNREGESNVVLECTMEKGAKLDIRRRVKK